MNHLRPRVPLHCVVEIDYAEVELRVAAAHAKKHAAQVELTERALDVWFVVEREAPPQGPKEGGVVRPTSRPKGVVQLATPRPDCGEAGHAEGRCGNAACGSAPTVVKSTNDEPKKRPLQPGDHVRRITDSVNGEVLAGCVRKVSSITSGGYVLLGKPVAGIGRKVMLDSEGKTWERVEWDPHQYRWVAV